MARPKAVKSDEETTQAVTANEAATEQVKKQAQSKKSKVGKFYEKVQFFERSADADQITTFDLKGQSKVLCVISLPEVHAIRLNKSAKYSGVLYREVK